MSVRMLHVAQPTDGGVGHYVAALVADQAQRGWTVMVASPPQGLVRAATVAAGAGWEPWAASRSPGLGIGSEVRTLNDLIRRTAPDLVHLHSSKAGLAGRLAMRGRRPTLFQPHGWSWLAAPRGLAGTIRGWERFGARWADRVVCVSDGEQQWGTAAGLTARFAVVRNGVDTASFVPASAAQRAAARQRLACAPDERLALCVGRLSHAKGQDVLLHAWPMVKAQVKGCRLALVGEGEDEERLRALADPSVHFAGGTSEVRSWYAAADVVVCPSRWEGLSLSLLEAAASGCSVVSTEVPGSRDVLEPCEPDAVVPIGSVPELAAAIARRLRDPTLARREGDALRERALHELDRQATFDTMAELVRTVLAERNAVLSPPRAGNWRGCGRGS